jgi:hypothetical protein
MSFIRSAATKHLSQREREGPDRGTVGRVRGFGPSGETIPPHPPTPLWAWPLLLLMGEGIVGYPREAGIFDHV